MRVIVNDSKIFDPKKGDYITIELTDQDKKNISLMPDECHYYMEGPDVEKAVAQAVIDRAKKRFKKEG